MRAFVSRNPRTARLALRDLSADTSIHGLSDGSWSLIDAITELLRRWGPAPVVVATWTASSANLIQAERLLRSAAITDFRLLVDRSFLARQPNFCATARRLFSDDSIRVWNAHCKFVVCGPILYITSANLNRNRRCESFSAFCCPNLVAEYLALVDKLFARQEPGAAFQTPSIARTHTEDILRD